MLGKLLTLVGNVAYLKRKTKELEEDVNFLKGERKTHEKIEQFYVDMIHDVVEKTVETAMEHAFQQPIELTHEEIEKAFGHRVKIVASKAGDK